MIELPASDIRVMPARELHASGLVELFERTKSPCFCRWWHFNGDKNEWLDRCANNPGRSKLELNEAFQRGSDEASGVIAVAERELIEASHPDIDQPLVVGWAKVAPATALKKVYDQRLYRGLDVFSGDRAAVYTLGCLLVDEDFRQQGVARALVDGAVDFVRSRGGSALEAFPRRAEGMRPEEMWTGPFSTLRAAGFAEVHRFEPYPVMRLDL